MSLKILEPLYKEIETINGFGPQSTITFKKLCGSRFLDVIFHLPNSLIKRIIVEDLLEFDLYKRVIISGIIKSTWSSYKKPKISIATIEIKNQLLEIIYFNVNKAWFHKNFVKGYEVTVSGELIKKGSKWQIIHPDYIFDKKSNLSVPIYETTYSLTSGLTHKKIKKAITQSTQALTGFNEWINYELIKTNKWHNFYDSILKLHFPETLEEVNNISIYRERIAYDEALARQLALNLIRKHKLRSLQSPLCSNNKIKNKLLKKLPFSLTEDQKSVLKTIYNNLNSKERMFTMYPPKGIRVRLIISE